MNESDKKKQCHGLYQTLLECQAHGYPGAARYLREFEETKNCDEVHDFSVERKNIQARLNKDDAGRWERVLTFKDTYKDVEACEQVYIHCHKWHRQQLEKALQSSAKWKWRWF